ncbi:4Fe-4S binding protein [Verrucomicrobia bacterium]|nr:4Fe-4S binding protein [Verrucomicrobiota bacterium]
MPVSEISDDCIKCGTCVATCPMDVFRLDEAAGKSTIVYPRDCQICHLCRLHCPVDAITITPEKGVQPMVAWA